MTWFVIIVLAATGLVSAFVALQRGSGLVALASILSTALIIVLAYIASPMFSSLSILGINGAPGYYTYTGQNNLPLQVGEPWGQPCVQVMLDAQSPPLPVTIYDQLSQVVSQAQRAGINVTISTPGGYWPYTSPPHGISESVGVNVSLVMPPNLLSGVPEHILFQYSAKDNGSGRYDEIDGMSATLYLTQLTGHPAIDRLAARQLVAFVQGVGGTIIASSGIKDGTSTDSFTSADISAMRIMSGCHSRS